MKKKLSYIYFSHFFYPYLLHLAAGMSAISSSNSKSRSSRSSPFRASVKIYQLSRQSCPVFMLAIQKWTRLLGHTGGVSKPEIRKA